MKEEVEGKDKWKAVQERGKRRVGVGVMLGDDENYNYEIRNGRTMKIRKWSKPHGKTKQKKRERDKKLIQGNT